MLPVLQQFFFSDKKKKKKATIGSMQCRGTVKLNQGLAMVCVCSLRIQEVFTPGGESSA